MPNFRRAAVPGGIFFFTLVTADRAPILCTDRARPILQRAIAECRSRWPVEWLAVVLLPDHLHALWALPPGDSNFSGRWAWIKRAFTSQFLASGGDETAITDFERRNRNRGVWQRQFIEHTPRDNDDLIHHIDYIHYNPAKHGLVSCPHKWAFSTFDRYVAQGKYPLDWNCCCDGRKPPAIDHALAAEYDLE